MMNTFIAIGRVVAEPELRKTNNGDSCTNFTLAVNRDNSDNTDFVDCCCYKKTSENFCKYVHKGDKIAIQGALRTNIENKRKYTFIKVSRITFLSEKAKNIDNINDNIDIPQGGEE